MMPINRTLGTGYVLIASAVCAFTGLLLSQDFSFMTLIGALTGLYFFIMWMYLGYENGLDFKMSRTITLLVYWVGMPIALALLGAAPIVKSLAEPAYVIKSIFMALLFAANYLLSFLFVKIGIDLWWTVAVTILGILISFFWGRHIVKTI